MKRKIIALLLGVSMIFNMSSIAYATEADENGDLLETEVVEETNIVDEYTDISEEELDKDVADMLANGRPQTSIITGMDEEGNIFVVEEEEDPVVQDMAMWSRSRTVTDKIVNFRANAAGQAYSSYDTISYSEYGTGAAGYTCGHYGADAAYLGTENGKVKFILAGVVGIIDESKVQVVNLSSVVRFSHYYANGTNLIHNIVNNLNGAGNYSSINVGPQPSYLANGTYYSYDGHYFYTDYGTMLADYRAGHRNNSVNPNSPYYNYFQYLPWRGLSNYTAGEMQTMINSRVTSVSKMHNAGAAFIDGQNEYGVNGLLMAAAGAHESGWGMSEIALEKSNLFGWNAVDSSPGQSANYFATVNQCINDFAGTYMSKQYLRAGWSYYHGGFLGDKASGMNVSYASDPYWGEKIAGIAWSLDNAYGQKDRFVYSIGIKDTLNTKHTELNVRKEATTGSTILYNTGSCSNMAFLILGESGDFYKVVSDPVLNSSRSAIDKTTGVHAGSSMYVFVSKQYVKKMLDGNGTVSFAPKPSAGQNHLVKYKTHVQTYGWQNWVSDGTMSGTEGQHKRLEGINISLGNTGYSGSVEYKTHVQTYGWQDWVKDGAMSGTEGESKRLEGIRIRLTGEVANHYDIYYRVHAQTHGWLDWAKNGQMAGTEGGAKRLEGIEIRLVKKGGAAPGAVTRPFVSHLLQYSSHVQTFGWQGYVVEPALSGTEGLAKRMESIRIASTQSKYNNNIEYQVHVQKYGWQDWKTAGELAGTTGESKRLEAMRIRLTGELAERYDVYYRVHCQTYGWLDWAKNGEMAGTSGLAKRMESFQVILVEKGLPAPGNTQRPCVEY